MRTYDRLCRFLSSYPDVTADESVKQIEIAALEQYIETGERKEHVSGVVIRTGTEEQKEKKDDERRKTGTSAVMEETAVDY